MTRIFRFLWLAHLSVFSCFASEVEPQPEVGSAWPALTRAAKPWTYWWWPASAVDATNITRQLERFAAAGYGGVHVVPIYGAKATNPPPIDYLSEAWLAMLRHTIKEGERLDLGVDMSLGTGWCFGGPTVTTNDAGLYLDAKTLKPRGTGIKVKRAAPGGEGFMLNPIYGDAMTRYLERFNDAFGKLGDIKPRAVYHDSYEYAKANFSPDFFAEFKQRRGYDLEPELKNLFAADASKLRCDYNETVSDLMVEKVMPQWIAWAHERGMITRYQAHGSPANWLDLYALADVPETEMFHTDRDILISKFASSAAHITGKKLVAAETGTWLEEHFTETLGDMKRLVDQLFLSGVNHVVYHGNCYSPDEAAWPGWLFYASTEMNSRNAIWRDLPALNAYIARCQSLLQAGEPDNDILLYWPIRDFWSHTKDLAPMMTVHKREWFYDEEIGKTAKWLWDQGYSFDYVSDRLMTNAVSHGGKLVTPGQGITTQVGLPAAEPMKKEAGLNFIRRRVNGQPLYFVVNDGTNAFNGWLPLRSVAKSVRAHDPMTGRTEIAATKEGTNQTLVRLELPVGASVFLSCSDAPATAVSNHWKGAAGKLPIIGNWRVEFIAGGPEMPVAYTTDKLASWTERGGAAESFAGTARYSVKFDAPGSTAGTPARETPQTGVTAVRWQLDLGEVHESARVKVNGKDFGTLIMPPYRVVVDNLKAKDNVLEVEVTNLSANRVRDLDRRKVDWKVMKDINLVNLDYKPFDASNWPVRPSGLLGPVTLAPLQFQ